MKLASKLALAIASLSIVGGNAFAQQTAVQNKAALNTYESQIGFQRRVVLEEEKALDEAYQARNNSVHIGKDLRDLLAYGISTGYLGYRFMDKTNNLQTLRDYLTKNKSVPSDLVPNASTPRVSPAEGEAMTLATAETNASRAALYRSIGSAAMRTAELTGAAVLGLFLLNDITQTGNDIYVRFTDTNDIRDHRDRLRTARNNLDIADRNLQAAIFTSGF